MSALAQGRATNFLNAEYGGGATPTTFAARTGNTKLVITTVVGTQAARGTQLAAGGSYVAGGSNVLWNAAAALATAFSASIGNQAWEQTNMPAAANLNGVEITDSAGTPVYMAYGGITGAPKSTNAGDTLSFPANTLVVSI